MINYHNLPTAEELQANKIDNEKKLEEADRNARETIERAEASSAKREAILQRHGMPEVRGSDEASEQ